MSLYLEKIMEAADAGSAVPMLKVFTPGLIITGYPTSRREFASAFTDADSVRLYGENMPEKRLLTRRSQFDAEDQQAWERAQEQAEMEAKPVKTVAGHPAPPDTLLLTDAAGLFTDGTKVAFDCIAVPFSSISAWTTGAQEVLAQPQQGGGWFIGGGLVTDPGA